MRVLVIGTEVRFYEQDGWSPQRLSCYVTKGEMFSVGCDSTKEKKYWSIARGSKIDTDKMFDDRIISEVVRLYVTEPEATLSDIQVLRSRSWTA